MVSTISRRNLGIAKRGMGISAIFCLSIILTVGFQQFPVIRLGGSFRLYELFAVLLLLSSLACGSLFKQRELWSTFFFVVAPVLSATLFWLGWKDDIRGYYESFGVRGEFRYGVFVAVAVPLLYYILSGVAFTEISKSRLIFERRETVVVFFVLVGNAIAIVALLSSLMNGMFGIATPIQLLPDFIQNVGKLSYGFRTYGFSQEPSFYVLYQGWVFLITYAYRHQFNIVARTYLLGVALLALMLTLSSALLGLVVASVFASLLLGSLKKRLRRLLYLTACLSLAVVAIIASGSGGEFFYAFYTKIVGFFSIPETTLDSGQFRAYTSLIGLNIFLDYPWTGVGPGASIFFMHAYEHAVPIRVFGESLNPGSFPQSSFASILSDLGIVGFMSFMGLWFYILNTLFRSARAFDEAGVFFTGSLFTFISLLSVAPAYSMFIWVLPAFGICVARGLAQSR